jgi:hypothetical protein
VAEPKMLQQLPQLKLQHRTPVRECCPPSNVEVLQGIARFYNRRCIMPRQFVQRTEVRRQPHACAN